MNVDRLHAIRRDYHAEPLSLENTPADPLDMFRQWFEQMLIAKLEDPNAMVLATVDEHGIPDARVVLLKGLVKNQFIFYTNYQSNKAKHLAQNPYAALNFYWPSLCRQIRIQGKVMKTSASVSDEYFASRPEDSQVGAIVSQQSHPVTRQGLETAVINYTKEHRPPYQRPHYWGGYSLVANVIEFWHGRSSRLHDRIHYAKSNNGEWLKQRLSP